MLGTSLELDRLIKKFRVVLLAVDSAVVELETKAAVDVGHKSSVSEKQVTSYREPSTMANSVLSSLADPV